MSEQDAECLHENHTVEPPCCRTVGSSGYIECGCNGQYSVYCNDCHNDLMTDSDVDRIIDQYQEYEQAVHERKYKYYI